MLIGLGIHLLVEWGADERRAELAVEEQAVCERMTESLRERGWVEEKVLNRPVIEAVAVNNGMTVDFTRLGQAPTAIEMAFIHDGGDLFMTLTGSTSSALPGCGTGGAPF